MRSIPANQQRAPRPWLGSVVTSAVDARPDARRGVSFVWSRRAVIAGAAPARADAGHDRAPPSHFTRRTVTVRRDGREFSPRTAMSSAGESGTCILGPP